MSDHELTTLLVSGLATIVSGLACIIFSWLRSDIRNLAESVTSLREEFHEHCEAFAILHGTLEGKGILK